MTKAEDSPEQPAPRAFVLSPIGGEFDEVYDQLIRPSLEQVGFTVGRADELDLQNIMSAVIRGISTADLVVAEITARNPNVMYELGIAHALAKPVVILTQDIDQVPFDLRSYRVVTYSPRFSEVGKLVDTLKRLAAGVVSGSLVVSSPVSDFMEGGQIGGQGTLVEGRAVIGDDDDDDDFGPGLFDHAERNVELFERLGAGTVAFGGAIEAVGERMVERTAEMSTTDSTRQGHTARMLGILRHSARDLDEFTTSARAYDELLDEVIPQVGETLMGVTQLTRIDDDETRASATEFRDIVKGLRTVMTESEASLQGFQQSIRDVRDLKLSRDFSKSAGHAVRVMESISGKLASFESDLARGEALLNERLSTP